MLSLYRLGVTMRPATVEGLNATSITFISTVDKADKKSNMEHVNPFSLFLFFLTTCQSVLWPNRISAFTDIKCNTSQKFINTETHKPNV